MDSFHRAKVTQDTHSKKLSLQGPNKKGITASKHVQQTDRHGKYYLQNYGGMPKSSMYRKGRCVMLKIL